MEKEPGKKKPIPKKGKGKSAAKKKASSVDRKIKKKIDKLCEAVIFAELSDPKALADIHSQLEEIGNWAKSASLEKTAEAVRSTAKLTEKVILEEHSDPEAAADIIGRALSTVKQITHDGRREDEIDFPADLIASEEVAGVPRASLEPTLPPNVDEKIFADFLAQQEGVMEEVEGLILSLEETFDEGQLADLCRRIHTLKGEAALLNLEKVEQLCHKTEDLLVKVETKEIIDILLGVKDWLSKLFSAYSGKGPAPAPVEKILMKVTAAIPPEEEEPVPEELVAFGRKEAEEEYPEAYETDPELLGDFISEAREHLHTSDVHLLTLETNPHEDEALHAVFRAFHTIKGVAGFLSLKDISSLAHEAENLLDRARKSELTLTGEAIDVTFDAVDVLKKLVNGLSEALSTGKPPKKEKGVRTLLRKIRAISSGKVSIGAGGHPMDKAVPDPMLGEILVGSGKTTREKVEAALRKQKLPLTPKRLGEILVEFAITSSKKVDKALSEQQEDEEKRKIGDILVEMGAAKREDVESAIKIQRRAPEKPRLGEILVRDGSASAKDVAQALRTQAADPAKAVHVKETLKVDAERLDKLVDTIGELVIAESMVSQSKELKSVASPQLSSQVGHLDKITRELQEMGMSLRMVPVRSTFQKMARLVRDLSRKSGKPIEFSMSGEDTELDKTVVEKMGDPLVHMIRNAIDHGIEPTSEERIKAGKPPAGRVNLRAYHKGGSIYIEVEDDGRGLDREVILTKALEKGLVKETEQLTEREVFSLILQPGFSTAQKVTDVSGRGVGMDVVKKNIDALRGQIEISSEKGQGALFILRLPLTLAIIDGMVLRLGSERFIIPTLSVVRSVKPDRDDLTTVLAKGEMINVQGDLIPLYRLAKLFSIDEAVQEPTAGLVVVVEDNNRQVGLLTDELLGQQQIVIKSLGEMMSNIVGISGGAIMPDGSVGLILDVGGIVKLATEEISTPVVEAEEAQDIQEDEENAPGEDHDQSESENKNGDKNGE